MKDNLLEVEDLRTYFNSDFGIVKAVDGVNFKIERGKIHGIVGESGCGKSVTARSIMRILVSAGKITRGKILFYKDGSEQEPIDLAAYPKKSKKLRSIRGKDIAMIFQEPMTAFSPVYTVGNQIMETILLHQEVDKKEARQQTIELLKKVGISKPEQRVDEYPHQLSGGMRQRAMIAMALSCNPRLLIADEPTTALDVTIQAQILKLMMDLQQEFNMSIMIITHDLGVIAEMADFVSVMYLGKVVEQAPVKKLFKTPSHPYTKSLLKSIPKIEAKKKKKLATIEGSVPDLYNIPSGCSFHPRCSMFKQGKCDLEQPELREIDNEHRVSCFFAEEVRNNE
ncbi:MAG: ABC transporter ATP-binding protein [Halanaerobiales bacterium]|nr:ABC transporter ATP-binding protein [Halanaerobiales bacterium]